MTKQDSLIDNADSKTLAKLSNFVSKSIHK